MVTKEECESKGKIFVPAHKDGKGGWTRAYCRKSDNFPTQLNRDELVPSYDDFYPTESLEDNLPDMDIVPYNEPEDLAGKKYKLPRSNLTNAKVIKKDISIEDKRIGNDLKKQDFEDIPFQASRIEKDAQKEAIEANKLNESQKVRAKSKYANQKNKISKREARETKNRIRKERKSSKRAIKTEKKRIRHEKKEEKREEKLSKLQER